ncbi:MAG: anaerobic C4-dicarboxylate transporter, partial [Selenomonadaceae bacterium]|nr:anaerobic C4-dicarboxylate transporter [Selenomonadaceae bacterium]
MEMFIGFIVLLVCLIVGVRHGGIGLAVISGIGLVIYTFVFHYKPGSPPIDVMLTILAVVTCAGFLQTSGGLTVMLQYAEKFLRNNPKHVTILAPLTTWFLTVLCGTGHVVYTMFPIIYDIAIKQNIRPERPMAVSSVASQMGICASPVSVAIVSIVGFMAASGYHYTVLQILAVSIPATGLGVFFAALW